MEAGLLSLDVSFSVTKNTTLHKHNKNCPASECVLEVMNLAMDVPSVGTINEGFKNELLHQYEIEKNEEATSSRQIASGSAQNEVLKEWQDAWDERDKDFEKQGINQQDSFWSKLKSEAARKVGAEEAERFCKSFQQIHKKLVNEELSLDAARSFLNSS
ncbi:hypothetical protein D0Y65_005290 [Glycine soja]|uniref:Uncharacterized protein n=1 Tax=Glycine soja TaxID=3848 RepID=A0A445LV42_GLYSO|nr:hypothetical protein D0Y65_005290 [Glycine soja]